MEKIDSIIRQRKVAHTSLIKRGSKVYKTFLDLEAAAYSDGALPKQTKELIAIGISIVLDCESCMQWHIDEAAKTGATDKEVLEAIEILKGNLSDFPDTVEITNALAEEMCALAGLKGDIPAVLESGRAFEPKC